MSVHVYMLFTNILPEAICCCLETRNVYVVFLMLFCIIMYKLSWPLYTANIRYLQVHLAYL